LVPSWVFNTVVNRAVADSDLSVLVALVTIAGLGDALSSPGEFTVLAPTNSAFGKLSEEVVEFLVSPEGKQTLTEILLYHVAAPIFTSGELEDGLELTTLLGPVVTVSINKTVMFNQATVVEVDILASNGVVHKIDEVLSPPVPPTIVEFVAGNDELTSLTVAVVRAGLVDALNGPGPLTLLAPNDDAFGAVPADLLQTLLTNDEFIPHLQDLLLYHVLAGTVLAIDLSDGLVAEALNGESLVVTLPPIAVNGNKVVDADNIASNGVVHIIDGVLAPSWVFNSITDRVIADTDLSTLLALVGLAGISIPDPGEFTLLAPTNDAFAKLPGDAVAFLTSPEGQKDLINILTYHVLVGIYTSGELEDGAKLPSAQGSDVVVSLNTVKFNQAGVVAVDILASNGVIHKIDDVLSPPLPNIVEIVATNPELTALTAAVVRAGLLEALAGPGPFTLFAPNNGAFAAVPAELVELLFTNDEFIPHLQNLLLYHVLAGEFFAIDLEDNLIAEALNGEELLITLPPIAINGNKVVDADLDASNGVVHIIDGVLTPSWIFNGIGDRVASDGDLSVLQTLLTIAEIDLSLPGEFTLLAPTNDAFSLVPQDTVEFLVSPEGKGTLASVLSYHVLLGIFTLDGFEERDYISLEGRPVSVTVDPVKFNCF
jgi:transforming growth factor-beta-induced protein